MFCSAVHFIRYTAAQIHTFHVQFRTLASQKFSYNPLLSYTTKCRVLRARFTTRRLVKVSRVTRDSVNSCSQFRQQLSHSNVELHVFSAINSAPNCDVYSLVITTSPCFIAVGGKKKKRKKKKGESRFLDTDSGTRRYGSFTLLLKKPGKSGTTLPAANQQFLAGARGDVPS